MGVYPINLILDNKPCVVLGGGHVALRKVKGLLEAKAKVTVISPQIVEGLAKLVETKSIIWQKKCYEQGDLTDFILAICAIGNEEVNAQVRKEANQKKVILNVVDRLEFCDFALPAKIVSFFIPLLFQKSFIYPILIFFHFVFIFFERLICVGRSDYNNKIISLFKCKNIIYYTTKLSFHFISTDRIS